MASDMTRASGICSTTQPFLIPGRVRSMVMHCLLSGVLELSDAGLVVSTLTSFGVPPQISTEGVQLLATVRGSRTELAEAG